MCDHKLCHRELFALRVFWLQQYTEHPEGKREAST